MPSPDQVTWPFGWSEQVFKPRAAGRKACSSSRWLTADSSEGIPLSVIQEAGNSLGEMTVASKGIWARVWDNDLGMSLKPQCGPQTSKPALVLGSREKPGIWDGVDPAPASDTRPAGDRWSRVFGSPPRA